MTVRRMDNVGNIKGVRDIWFQKQMSLTPLALFTVRVERWGRFLAILQEKDYAYNGSKGAKSLDPSGWEKWNSTQEHINASQKVRVAVRRAKITWPLRPFGFAVAVLGGAAGFFVSPVIGFIIGGASYIGTELLAQFLLNRGY